MGTCIGLTVFFRCDQNDNVATVAAKHLEYLRARKLGTNAELLFLLDLAARRGANAGQKGGLSVWGSITNGADVHLFVSTLFPFWYELLAGFLEGGPRPYNKIVVLHEREEEGFAQVYEISFSQQDDDLLCEFYIANSRAPDPTIDEYIPELRIRQFSLPFSLGI